MSTRAPASTERRTCSSSSSQYVGGGQRTDLRGLLHRVAHHQLGHRLHEAPLEFAGDRFFHDEALGGDAALAVVDDARLHGGAHRGVEIRAGHHDEGIAAAQFEHASS